MAAPAPSAQLRRPVMPPTAIAADAASSAEADERTVAANERADLDVELARLVQGEHDTDGDEAEPGQLDRHGGGALGEELAARDAVREGELELAGLLVVGDGAGAPADGGDRDQHEADEAEERRLHVPGAGRDLVVARACSRARAAARRSSPRIWPFAASDG